MLLNFEWYSVLSIVLPRFDVMHAKVNFGSPYRKALRSRGCPPFMLFIDILALTVPFLKSSGR